MDSPKKCDTRNRLSSGRKKSPRSFRAVDSTERASASAMDKDGNSARRLTFAEDYMMEHSANGPRVAVVGVNGSSRTVRIQSQPSTQHFGFPS
jgi:hypothetical protein